MRDLCFCHFNGYEVKDAKARREMKTSNHFFFASQVSNNGVLDEWLQEHNEGITLFIDTESYINNPITLKDFILVGNRNVKLHIESTLTLNKSIVRDMMIYSNNETDYVFKLGEPGTNTTNNIIEGVYFVCKYAMFSECENDNLIVKNCRMFSGARFLKCIVPSNSAPSEAVEISGNHINALSETPIELNRFATLNIHNNIINNSYPCVHLENVWGCSYHNNHHEMNNVEKEEGKTYYALRFGIVKNLNCDNNLFESFDVNVQCGAVEYSYLGFNRTYDNSIMYETDGNCLYNTINCKGSTQSVNKAYSNTLNGYLIPRVKNISDTTYTITSDDAKTFDTFVVDDTCQNIVANYGVFDQYKKYAIFTRVKQKTFNFQTDRGIQIPTTTNLTFSVQGSEFLLF